MLTLATLKSFETRLPVNKFMRVQRSYIVALDKVRAVSKTSVWIAEREINVGDQYKASVQEVFNKSI